MFIFATRNSLYVENIKLNMLIISIYLLVNLSNKTVCTLARIFKTLILLCINELDTEFNSHLNGSQQHSFKRNHSTITIGLEQGSGTCGSQAACGSFSFLFAALEVKFLLNRSIKSSVTLYSCWIIYYELFFMRLFSF